MLGTLHKSSVISCAPVPMIMFVSSLASSMFRPSVLLVNCSCFFQFVFTSFFFLASQCFSKTSVAVLTYHLKMFLLSSRSFMTLAYEFVKVCTVLEIVHRTCDGYIWIQEKTNKQKTQNSLIFRTAKL